MRTAPWTLTEREPGAYQARVRFVMPAEWSVGVEASGDDVVSATARLQVAVDRAPSANAAPDDGSALAVLPTRGLLHRLRSLAQERRAAMVAPAEAPLLAEAALLVGPRLVVDELAGLEAPGLSFYAEARSSSSSSLSVWCSRTPPPSGREHDE
jgi:hypothetical protein